jgi:UDP-N-acetylmuramoyl-L-alanyl-D-glutamate--2,6-diaminopimelate ligase
MWVQDSRLALAKLSAAFFDYPSRKMTVVGVTGTDGKTTTSTLIYQILRAAGYTTGLISTVSALIGTEELDTGFHVTTPEATEIQAYLAMMAAKGSTHVVIETTSHGLAQQRVTACEFDIGVVTNITHEHLDYHGSYQAYREAKGRLFRLMAQTPPKADGIARMAVINRDDSSYEFIRSLIDKVNKEANPALRVVTFGVHPEAECRGEALQIQPSGLSFEAAFQGRIFPIKTSLMGEFNVSNCLAAIAVTCAGLGISSDAIQEGISSVRGIPGRMERIDLGQDFLAIVDFAHTPHALRQALKTARQMLAHTVKSGRVICLFGSAGLRDRAKRRMMAEAAAGLADISILTAEDPRNEPVDDILAEMAAGAESKGAQEVRDYWRIRDRGEAFRFAVKIARPGDLVIALGKGHEQSMCFGEVEFPWDDRVAMRAAISELSNIPGPAMPSLPTSKQSDKS